MNHTAAIIVSVTVKTSLLKQGTDGGTRSASAPACSQPTWYSSHDPATCWRCCAQTTVIDEDREFVEQYFEMPDEEMDANRLSPWLLRIELNREMMVDKKLSAWPTLPSASTPSSRTS